jgi:hypothetical protein
MWRNPPSLGQAAMLSARQPDDVLRRSGKAGCDVEILILIVLSILAVWILFNFNAGAQSPSPSPNPSATINVSGSLPPPT